MKNIFNDPNKNKKISFIKNSFLSLFYLLSFISFFRIPIIGIFLDGVFFEFLFGYSKYLIYLLIFISMFFIHFKKYFYFLFNNRRLILYILIIISFSLILGCIYYYLYDLSKLQISEFYLNSNYAYFDHWYFYNWKNILNIQTYNQFNIYSFGGLIGIVFISLFQPYLSIAIAILLFTIFLVLLLISFINKASRKIRNKLIKKLGGFISKEISISNSNNNNFIDVCYLHKKIKELMLKKEISFDEIKKIDNKNQLFIVNSKLDEIQKHYDICMLINKEMNIDLKLLVENTAINYVW